LVAVFRAHRRIVEVNVPSIRNWCERPRPAVSAGR